MSILGEQPEELASGVGTVYTPVLALSVVMQGLEGPGRPF